MAISKHVMDVQPGDTTEYVGRLLESWPSLLESLVTLHLSLGEVALLHQLLLRMDKAGMKVILNEKDVKSFHEIARKLEWVLFAAGIKSTHT